MLAHAALDATRHGKGGFADQLIAQAGFANGATEGITLDDKFAKTAKVR